MAIKYAIQQFPTSAPAKTLCRLGGSHIYSVQLTEDAWNGKIITKNDWLGLDLYKEGTAATAFEGIVRQKAANGKWYVEITKDFEDLGVLYVYEAPIIEEEYNNTFKKESNFCIPKDTVTRCYALCKGDVIELSEDGFSGTVTAGAVVNGVTAGKPTI